MVATPIYLDNHATTRVDPRVVEAMLPHFTDHYGNAGSTSHVFGEQARHAVDEARSQIAAAIHAAPRDIVFTSGATESNNLALRGLAERRRTRGHHIVSVATEHKAILDPLARLAQNQFEVTLLNVTPHDRENAGLLDLEQLAAAIRPDTLLVTVMLVNNEIGVIQPLAEIAAICRQHGVLLHTDASQAVGRIPVNVEQLGVDLMSVSAHKFYGPKGVGVLYVRRQQGKVRLLSQITGGGQEQGLRSGTLNVPGIVGCARALELCRQELPHETTRLRQLAQRLFTGLTGAIEGVTLNGPSLQREPWRVPGNVNCQFAGIEGEALMLNARDVAVSSGSACTSADPAPSHVLAALGLTTDQARSSLRFGIGRFNTVPEIDYAITSLAAAARRLRELTSDGGMLH